LAIANWSLAKDSIKNRQLEIGNTMGRYRSRTVPSGGESERGRTAIEYFLNLGCEKLLDHFPRPATMVDALAKSREIHLR
jgi:hypothetical protein